MISDRVRRLLEQDILKYRYSAAKHSSRAEADRCIADGLESKLIEPQILTMEDDGCQLFTGDSEK